MHTAVTPPKLLLRPTGRAIADFDMIRAGDRILLGVSGGKDSQSLLHILLHLQRRAPVRFELGVVTVDPQVEGFDPSPLKEMMAMLGVPYAYRAQAIMEQARQNMGKASFCAYCSRMKRGIMYATARAEGYNVLALAHHLDDAAETFLMSVFHGGKLRSMRPHYLVDAGDLRVIRPLIYARERQTRDYAQTSGLPVIGDNCPACFRMPTERQAMKELLARQEQGNPLLFKSVLSALRPLF